MVHECIFGSIIISILVTGGRVVTPYPLAVGTLPAGGRPPFQYILLLSPTGGGNFIDIWSEHAAILPTGGGNLLAVCGLLLNVYSVMSTMIIYYPLAVGSVRCSLIASLICTAIFTPGGGNKNLNAACSITCTIFIEVYDGYLFINVTLLIGSGWCCMNNFWQSGDRVLIFTHWRREFYRVMESTIHKMVHLKKKIHK